MKQVLFVLLSLTACTKASGDKQEKDKDMEPVAKLAGVWPERFDCKSVTPDAELATTLGGDIKQVDNPVPMPRGVAMPCKYEVTVAGVIEMWSFDFDCRPNYKQTADTLFVEYRRLNEEKIAEYNKLADAGQIKANDAGISTKPPPPPADVAVGAKGLDHHGNGLLFLDDDAPCYVRISGLDEAKRLALGQLLAKNLTYMNAPMEPRRPK